MRRIATVAAAALVLIGAGAGCRERTLVPDRFSSEEVPRQDWGILVVGVKNGKCDLIDRFSQIRTDQGSQVKWIVIGYCPSGGTIEIDPKINKGGPDYEPFKSADQLKKDIPTEPGQYVELTADIIDRVKNEENGKYKYKVRISGNERLMPARAGDDEFRLCPVWPCG